jgi:hypothetical protein
MTQRTDENVEETLANVDNAKAQLSSCDTSTQSAASDTHPPPCACPAFFSPPPPLPNPNKQGEMTQRIDENVEETLANVDNAKAQLMRYLNTISSNRWLMLKAFGVLMIFLVIFIGFIA